MSLRSLSFAQYCFQISIQLSAYIKFMHAGMLLSCSSDFCRYPTTVATLSRRARDVIEEAFEKSADGGRSHFLVGSRLHDFGMRGCTGKKPKSR